MPHEWRVAKKVMSNHQADTGLVVLIRDGHTVFKGLSVAWNKQDH